MAWDFRWRDVAMAVVLGGIASLAYGLPTPQLPMAAGYAAVLVGAVTLGWRCGLLTALCALFGLAIGDTPGIGWLERLVFVVIAGGIVMLAYTARLRRGDDPRYTGDFLKRFQADREQRALLDHLPKMVWIAEPDGTTRYQNRYWFEYSGLSGDQDWRTIVHPDDLEGALLAWHEALSKAQALTVEMRLRRAQDNQYRWHLVNGVPIIGADGRVQCWYGASTDIEDQKRAMETLELAHQRISRFLAVLSHELRNPMAGMSSACELLQREDIDAEQRQQALALLNRQSQHLHRMVDDLLDISRVTQGKVELRRSLVELTALLDEVHQDNLAAARIHGVVLDAPQYDSKSYLHGDKARLRQVLDNLVSNAIKACGKGQHVGMRVERHGNEAVIEVADQGQGLHADFIVRMFEPFVQSATWQSRGLGLGLSIVKQIAEQHGGRVTAQSEGPGYGAQFRVHLPLVERPHVPAGAVADPMIETRATARVLLVEDEVENAQALQTLLSLEGHDVAIAASADSAMAQWHDQPFDVVVCDLELKDGPSGFEVAQMLGMQSAPPYLIAYSGYGQRSDSERTRQAGFQRHLVKPATVQEILSAIEEGLQYSRRPSYAGPSSTVTT